jgi:hypothetical protein
MTEQMKDIPNYEGRYAITNDGRVWSYPTKMGHHNGKYKSITLTSRGYPNVRFSDRKSKAKAFLIHRLVAECFIPNPENKKTVNHKNGIKTDNRVENLEWMSHSENVQHSYDNGLEIASCEFRKYTMKEVLEIKSLYKTGLYSHRKIGKMYNISHGTVGAIIRNERKLLQEVLV